MKGAVLTFIMTMVCLGAFPASFTPPCDIVEAMELCDKADLRPVEGLWLFPEDEVTVMIYRDADNDSHYNIYVVESVDCSLSPKDKLGVLQISPDPNKFKLSLFTRVKKGILTLPCGASAVLSTNNESITVTKPTMKVSIYPGRLLTGFWGIVRLSMKSGANVPEGLIKVYPSYDGNGSSKRQPRYL